MRRSRLEQAEKEIGELRKAKNGARMLLEKHDIDVPPDMWLAGWYVNEMNQKLMRGEFELQTNSPKMNCILTDIEE